MDRSRVALLGAFFVWAALGAPPRARSQPWLDRAAAPRAIDLSGLAGESVVVEGRPARLVFGVPLCAPPDAPWESVTG